MHKRTSTSSKLPVARKSGRSKRGAANPVAPLAVVKHARRAFTAGVTILEYKPISNPAAHLDACKIIIESNVAG